MRYTRLKVLAMALGIAGLASFGARAAGETFLDTDVGLNGLAGSVTTTTTNVTVVGGGSDIWGTADHFNYYYTTKEGSFDAVVRISSLTGTDGWCKAEIMAREAADDGTGTLVPASDDRHLSVMTTRTTADGGVGVVGLQERVAGRAGDSINPGATATATYPMWLRLKRLGDVFYLYSGTDGVNWTELGSSDTSTTVGGTFNRKLLVGIAVTGHSTTTAATAVFDNLIFNLAPPEVLNATPANHASYVNPSTSFTFTVNSVQGVPSTNVVLKVNGVDKSSALTFSGTDFGRQVTYPGPFVANTIYNLEIIATDVKGITSTVPIAWDTFKQDNFSIEAEDFNYSSGHYNDNPGIGSLSPYALMVGTPLIDENDPSEGGAHHDYRPYDTNTLTGEIVGTKTMPNEVVRKAYADAMAAGDALAIDYAVGWIDTSEWLNYTRTFPSGTYQMSARIASSGGYGLRFDWVTSTASAANQTTCPFGIMSGPAIAPGTSEIFGFAPLTDAFGTQLIQRFTAGVKTMRFNKVSGDVDLNFYQFVPVADPGTLTPYVSTVYPAKNQTGINPLTDITATITDRDTKLVSSTIQMVLDGTNDVTATLKKTTLVGGLTMTYSTTNVYAASSVHTVTLIYGDNAATPNKFTNSWQFTILGGYSVLPAADALPVGSGSVSGFVTRLVQTSTGSAHTLAWTENTLMGVNPIIVSASDAASTLINYNGNGSSGNFANDESFSTAFGLPAAFDTTAINFATETVAYLDLKRGFYRFGVNSDDDFWVTEGSMPGNAGRVGGIALGQYDGNTGRGVADTTFDFVAPVDGLYPFRLAFEQGAGGFGFEWFSVDPVTGTRTLINDPNTAGSVKAYRFDTAMPANVVTIATNLPPTLSVNQNSKMALSAVATATLNGNVITNNLLFTYHWTKDGADITGDPAIVGVNSPVLSIDLAQLWHFGVYQCEISLPGFPAIKSVACTVSIVQDVTPPSVTSIKGGGSLTTVTINFSEPIDSSSLIPSSFAIDGGLVISGVEAFMDPTTSLVTQAILTTSLQTEGKVYNVTINNVKDSVGNPMTNVKASFTAYVTDPTVKMLCEFYDNIGSISALQASAKYLADMPDRVIAAPDFQTPLWENGDNYGGRLAAVVTAPATGNYIFHITSDDNSQLYVSQDETPGNWVLAADGQTPYVAAVNGWTNQRDWANTNSVPSAPIALVAGHKYYIEALWNEGGGGDGCAVGWELPGNTNIVVIPASALGSQRVDISNAKIQIGQQPAAVTTPENTPATFSLTVTNATSQFSTTETVNYQWQKNGVNVAANGNSATYTIALAQLADAATYTCVMHVPGLSVTSAPAVLTVTKDVTAPVAVSAGTLTTAPTTVGVLFSEVVDPVTAQTIANYTVSGATVTSATLLPSSKAVALSLSAAVVSGATVKVENIKDVASTPNTLASTTLTIAFSDLTSQDVGTVNATNSALFSDPIYVGSTVALGNGAFEVKAGGSDIWNNADGFHFTYKEVTGNFEAKVRVESLQYVSDNWAKAGLMFRESLEGGSRNVNCVVDPTAGANIWEPNYRADTNGASAGIPGAFAQVPPVSYPNAWIKLTRAEQVISTFKSTNGLDWVMLASYTNTVTTNLYPAKMLVGMCATAHNNSGTNTVAEFRDYVLTTGGTPAQAPTMTAKRSAGNLVITWDATLGAGYQLYSASTIKGTWAVEGTAPVTANGVVTVTLPATENGKFFKLQK
jgi:hypothetical protein